MLKPEPLKPRRGKSRLPPLQYTAPLVACSLLVLANAFDYALNLWVTPRSPDFYLTYLAALTDDPPSNELPEYVEKYAAFIARNSWTPESFAADYSVPLRVEATRLEVDDRATVGGGTRPRLPRVAVDDFEARRQPGKQRPQPAILVRLPLPPEAVARFHSKPNHNTCVHTC